MTLEGLKQLRSRLLKEKTYFVVSNLEDLTTRYDADRFYTEEEIIRLENTNGIVQECSKLLEDLAYYFIPNFNNVNQIALSSMGSPVISESILNKDIIDKDSWSKSVQDEIAKYFMDVYAYVDFEVSECRTIIGKDELCEISEKVYKKISNYLRSILKKYNVSGFIKYDEFAKSMQYLGYDLEVYLGKTAKTFEDYKKNCFDFTSLDIIAKFDDEKVKTKK